MGSPMSDFELISARPSRRMKPYEPREVDYRDVAERVGDIARGHACFGTHPDADLGAYAHARAAAHFARLHLRGVSE
jgi:hypothetical protein